QHAEHYFRLIAAAQEQFRQNQPQPRTDSNPEMTATEDSEDDGEGFSHFGQEPGFVPQQQQPFMRDNNQREGQPYQRDQQPREHHRDREHRPQPQYQPQPP